MFRNGYGNLRQRAKELFDRNPSIPCPYFGANVVLNAEGSTISDTRPNGSEVSPNRCSSSAFCRWRSMSFESQGTVQEYRRIWQPIGKVRADGMRAAKEVEYWCLVANIGPRPDKIRVILRRVGNGNVTFWA